MLGEVGWSHCGGALGVGVGRFIIVSHVVLGFVCWALAGGGFFYVCVWSVSYVCCVVVWWVG